MIKNVIRKLKRIKLLNVALTGLPMNPHAIVTGTFMKSLNNYCVPYCTKRSLLSMIGGASRENPPVNYPEFWTKSARIDDMTPKELDQAREEQWQEIRDNFPLQHALSPKTEQPTEPKLSEEVREAEIENDMIDAGWLSERFNERPSIIRSL